MALRKSTGLSKISWDKHTVKSLDRHVKPFCWTVRFDCSREDLSADNVVLFFDEYALTGWTCKVGGRLFLA